MHCAITKQHDEDKCKYAHTRSGVSDIICYYCGTEGHETMTCQKKVSASLQKCCKKTKCHYHGNCFFMHTENELDFFKKTRFNWVWKRYECKYQDSHSPDKCGYAHGDADALCGTCGTMGHFEKNCLRIY